MQIRSRRVSCTNRGSHNGNGKRVSVWDFRKLLNLSLVDRLSSTRKRCTGVDVRARRNREQTAETAKKDQSARARSTPNLVRGKANEKVKSAARAAMMIPPTFSCHQVKRFIRLGSRSI